MTLLLGRVQLSSQLVLQSALDHLHVDRVELDSALASFPWGLIGLAIGLYRRAGRLTSSVAHLINLDGHRLHVYGSGEYVGLVTHSIGHQIMQVVLSALIAHSEALRDGSYLGS